MRIARLLVGLGCLVGMGAQAALVTQTVVLPSQSTNVNTSLTFSGFDASLGTLQNVHLDLSGSFANSIGFQNSGSAAVYSISFSQSAQVRGPNGSTVYDSLNLPVSFSRSMAAGESFPSGFGFGGGLSLSTLFALTPRTYAGAASWNQPADLAAFIGPGNVLLPFIATATQQQSYNGNGIVLGRTNVSATASLSYEYSVVPLPAALPLAISGLALLGGFTRRRRARS